MATRRTKRVHCGLGAIAADARRTGPQRGATTYIPPSAGPAHSTATQSTAISNGPGQDGTCRKMRAGESTGKYRA